MAGGGMERGYVLKWTHHPEKLSPWYKLTCRVSIAVETREVCRSLKPKKSHFGGFPSTAYHSQLYLYNSGVIMNSHIIDYSIIIIS